MADKFDVEISIKQQRTSFTNMGGETIQFLNIDMTDPDFQHLIGRVMTALNGALNYFPKPDKPVVVNKVTNVTAKKVEITLAPEDKPETPEADAFHAKLQEMRASVQNVVSDGKGGRP